MESNVVAGAGTAVVQPADSSEVGPTTRALLEVVKSKFGQQLGPQELERVLAELDRAVRNDERLATAKLSNADEPDTIFHAI